MCTDSHLLTFDGGVAVFAWRCGGIGSSKADSVVLQALNLIMTCKMTEKLELGLPWTMCSSSQTFGLSLCSGVTTQEVRQTQLVRL